MAAAQSQKHLCVLYRELRTRAFADLLLIDSVLCRLHGKINDRKDAIDIYDASSKYKLNVKLS